MYVFGRRKTYVFGLFSNYIRCMEIASLTIQNKFVRKWLNLSIDFIANFGASVFMIIKLLSYSIFLPPQSGLKSTKLILFVAL